MNDPEFKQLVEIAARRPLNADEEARLRSLCAVHSGAQAQWDEEMQLNQWLKQLPPAPVSSNFTARVLQAVECEVRRPANWLASFWRGWVPSLRWTRPVAVAGLFLCVGMLSYQQYDSHYQTELAQDVAKVSQVARIPSVELLKDFDAINSLGQSQLLAVDAELLEILK